MGIYNPNTNRMRKFHRNKLGIPLFTLNIKPLAACELHNFRQFVHFFKVRC